MGACASKPKRKSGNPKDKDEARHKEEDEFHDIKNEKNNRKKDANDKKSANLSSEDSNSSSDSSDSSGRPAKVKSSKKMKRTKNGGLVMVSNKTIIGGDNIVIGEGSKIVNVNIGDRRDRRDSRSKQRAARAQSSQKQRNSQAFFSKLVNVENTNYSTLPGCFKQMKDKRVLVLDMKHLCDVTQSVGKLCSPSCCATCFRVGSKYIMTALHAIQNICEHEYIPLPQTRRGSFAALENNTVYVDFEYLEHNTTRGTQKFYLTSNVAFKNRVLDVAVIELKKGTSNFPPAFHTFSKALPNKTFTLVGHPFGEVKQLNKTEGLFEINEQKRRALVDWSRHTVGIDGFAGIEVRERILFHCSFEKGASGSPGVAVVDGRAVVVTMLLHGYPDWVYDPACDPAVKDQATNDRRIEQGVNMLELYNTMHAEDKDLCNAIFGTNEEQKGEQSTRVVG